MISPAASAFKPYHRQTSATVPSTPTSTTDGLSPTDKMSPLSLLLAEMMGAGILPAELQAALQLQLTPVVLQPPSSLGCATTSAPTAAGAAAAADAAGGKAKRKRTTFTASQAAILEKEYDSDQYMPRSRRIAVAESLQLSENQIKTWFQNRRAKDKKIRGACTVPFPPSTVLLPSSSPLMLHSPAPSAESSSSSTPPLSASFQQMPHSDPMPSLIELLALGKTDLLPLLNSQLLNSLNSAAASPPQ